MKRAVAGNSYTTAYNWVELKGAKNIPELHGLRSKHFLNLVFAFFAFWPCENWREFFQERRA